MSDINATIIKNAKSSFLQIDIVRQVAENFKVLIDNLGCIINEDFTLENKSKLTNYREKYNREE